MPRVFHFRQFSMTDYRSAHKIGTDSVILGAWAPLEQTNTILDIGCGSGLLSLMLAHRSEAHVYGIEIDEASYEDACLNARFCAHKDRLHFYQGKWQNMPEALNKTFDLLISNPPFFRNSFVSEDARKNRARHDQTLGYKDYFLKASDHMHDESRLIMIFPEADYKDIDNMALENGFHKHRELIIYPKTNLAPNRVAAIWKKYPATNLKSDAFAIRHTDNSYTKAYRNFVYKYYISL